MQYKLRLASPYSKWLLSSICAVLLAVAAPAWAQLDRDAAAAAARRLTSARVLSVEQAEAAQGPVWRVKVVTAHGEVRVILLDAISGQVL